MNRTRLLVGTAISAVAGSLLLASPALAAGTQAGSTITNNVTVQYQVGGIAQTQATASNTVTVDRKVDLVVARTDASATIVTPGATAQAVSFTVTNTSNATLDFQLSASQRADGESVDIFGNDSFDTTGGFTYYLDDGDGVFDAGDTLITHLNALAPDSPVVVHVVAANVPSGLANASVAGIILTATAKENNNGTGLGTDLTQATTNTAGMDTIFADAAGFVDGARTASFSAIDAFQVFGATLSATKSSRIVAGDFGTGAFIPGATIEYCIAVSNAAGSATAENIVLSDTLPSEVTYVDAFGVLVGGPDCNTPGTGVGSESAGVVTGTVASLPADTTQTLIFRATIN
ncbi:hypothetical protein [Alteraurantiacibacter palmitatis]|uniref:DUF11 domain-containing protein n=1 Tax=Alteraurantiacibacter palmitatis TaxID=2054628 RepID=A0ABV7E6Z3_9SPHN